MDGDGTLDQDREIDLTALEHQNGQVEVLEEIVASLVHELRNPLAVVKGFAVALEEATDRMDEEMMRTSAGAIRRNSDHLSALLDSFVDVYSLTADRMRLNRMEVLVGELVHQTVTDLTPVLNGNPVRTDIRHDGYALLDPLRIRQALTNLLANAAKYGPRDSAIDVSVERTRHGLDIIVADEGPGIPPERTSQLFQRFSRLGAEGSGMGIGLFISKGIARAHGGDLFLDDSEVGCRFVLRLPAGSSRKAPDSRDLEHLLNKDHEVGDVVLDQEPIGPLGRLLENRGEGDDQR